MKTTGMTHIGNVRTTNEDTVLLSCDKKPYYMLVADGMGGHAAGEIASKTAASAVQNYIDKLAADKLTSKQILGAVKYANSMLISEMEKDSDLQGMGTTLTFVYVEGDDLTIAQVGDSSAFLFDGTELRKLTKDHTYVQHLIDNGVIEKNAEQDYPFKNIITRAVGMRKLEVDICHALWGENDILVLCSDGLTSYIKDETLQGVLSSGADISVLAQALMNGALAAGGKDNISLIIAQNTPEEGAP